MSIYSPLPRESDCYKMSNCNYSTENLRNNLFPFKQLELKDDNYELSKMIQDCHDDKKNHRLSVNPETTGHVNKIFKNIYLGDLQACKDWYHEAQKKLEQQFVIISTAENLGESQYCDNVDHRILNIPDDGEAWQMENGIKDNLNQIFYTIDQARLKNLPVLIHCLSGQSRSVTMLAAYLMWSCGQPAESVLYFLKTKRVMANPSSELQQILKNQFQELLEKNTFNLTNSGEHNRR